MNYLSKQSDTIGILSSGLCMIHCLATPFFFIAATCTATCCNGAPTWWQWLDYFFLVVSFVAVNRSTSITDSKIVKIGLWLSWVSLVIFILNAKFLWFHTSPNTKFIPAFTLIGLHLYNLSTKTKKCENDCC